MHKDCLCARIARIAGYALLMIVVGHVGGLFLERTGEALSPALDYVSTAIAEPDVPAVQTAIWSPAATPDPTRSLEHRFDWIRIDADQTFWPWHEYHDASGNYSQEWLAPLDVQLETRERLKRLEATQQSL